MKEKATDLIKTFGGLLFVALPFMMMCCIWFPSKTMAKICISDIVLIICMIWTDKYINDSELEETEE